MSDDSTNAAPEMQTGHPDSDALSDSRWQRDAMRPLLIAAVSTSVLIGPVSLLRLITGENRLLSLLPFFIFVALQTVYTRHWLDDPRHRWFRSPGTRLGEIVLVLILLRLVVWYAGRQPLNREVVRAWLLDPAGFFDLLFLISAMLTLLCWVFAASFTGIFLKLGLTPDELLDYGAQGQERAWVQAIPRNRQALLNQFSEMWMWGGAILTFTAALSRVEFTPRPGRLVGITTLGLTPELILALLIYFLGGLLLISQGRLAILRAQWQRQNIPGIARVTKRWRRNSLLAILGVGLAASLLPFGSSFGLAIILGAVIQVLTYIMLAIMALFSLLISLLFTLFGSEQAEQIQAEPPPALPEPPATSPAIANLPLPPWFGGAVFWTIVIAAALYLTVVFVQRRRSGMSWIGRAWFTRLRQWWRIWRGRAGDLAGAARRRLRSSALPALPASVPTPWRFVRLGGLSPTERTRYFYLSTVRRAAKLGVERRAGQTPLEFERTLSEHWPEADAGIDDLTGSFLAARYAPAPLTETEAGRARRAWEQIKRLFRRNRESPDAAAPTQSSAPPE